MSGSGNNERYLLTCGVTAMKGKPHRCTYFEECLQYYSKVNLSDIKILSSSSLVAAISENGTECEIPMKT